MTAHHATWLIAALATAGVILRPWKLAEAWWATAGAAVLVLAGLLPWRHALAAVNKGTDVYLFLAGMMLLSELARREGLFDYVAEAAARHARGSGARLFLLVYATGTLVTVFMSNDATAVVLTPAVYAATRKAGVKPLPYLFACALVANAASFVLPISNPANLVVFGPHLPPLGQWVRQFALASLASIAATYLALRWLFRAELAGPAEAPTGGAALSFTGKLTAGAIAVVAAVLLAASGAGWDLGLPTLATAGIATAVVLGIKRENPGPLLRHVSWGVLPLVAGLFVLVEGLADTGLLQAAAGQLRAAAGAAPGATAWGAGLLAAFGCNLVNNLPAGLLAGTVGAAADATPAIRSAIAIGIDLGPNLSVTGSLATLLWLTAIRREGEDVGAWQFLKVGAIAMPLALVPALLGLWLTT